MFVYIGVILFGVFWHIFATFARGWCKGEIDFPLVKGYFTGWIFVLFLSLHFIMKYIGVCVIIICVIFIVFHTHIYVHGEILQRLLGIDR